MKIKALFLLLFIGAIQANAQHSDKIKASAKLWAEAQSKKDFSTLAEYTYTGFVSSKGGKEQWILSMQRLTNNNQKKGNPRNLEVGEPGSVFKAADELHCIVPIKIIGQIPRGFIITNSSLLAISNNNGDSWTFAEVTYMTNEMLEKWFPNFNKDLVIPKVTSGFQTEI